MESERLLGYELEVKKVEPEKGEVGVIYVSDLIESDIACEIFEVSIGEKIQFEGGNVETYWNNWYVILFPSLVLIRNEDGMVWAFFQTKLLKALAAIFEIPERVAEKVAELMQSGGGETYIPV